MLMEIAYGVAALAATPTAQVHSSELGKAGAQCRPDENGPAIIIDVAGLKDRVGLLKLEVWPPHDDDFLQDDNVLVAQGKIFRRLELPLRRDTPLRMCIRVPRPGTYAVSLLHDRDSSGKFSILVDGVGFAQNPKLGWRKPNASAVTLTVGRTATRSRIVLNYHRGFLSFAPLKGE